ncbi:MAG: FKBP-type peptidyl-prolyl cis-trans isomerase [Cytophagales bacterium]|nr:FKBP-type peptidyl-prolyl cis-trans isomerase [Bernardetiaceae bacterium]MDW8204222.1 FKBP-type peptidyl-prolyl cis-trans isomerase [Cytophagales bacterium]
MKKIALLTAACTFLLFVAKAQDNCHTCLPKQATSANYCHTSTAFNGLCAQFKEKQDFFLLLNGKTARKVKVGKANDTAYLLSIANDKNLKITAAEILFIQQALQSWSVVERRLGFAMQPSGLGIKIIQEGTGELPPNGKNVIVHYTGYLEDGSKFDSSVDRGQPFSFTLGAGQVIKGWDEGIAKLKIGTKAVLLIPAHLGYGSRGAGGVIPPNATLFFEVELLGVE